MYAPDKLDVDQWIGTAKSLQPVWEPGEQLKEVGREHLAMLVWPDRQGRLPADQVERLLELRVATTNLERK